MMAEATIGMQIRRLRIDRVLSQLDVADKMGCSGPWISQVENGVATVTAIIVDEFADMVKATVKQRKVLHRLGAQSQGWDV